MTLTLEVLSNAVAGTCAAIRSNTRLQPAGGPGDKVFPPTFVADDKSIPLKYAHETRRIDGRDVKVVLLDSVASQANRMEEALLAAWEGGQLDFPVIGVDFSGEDGLEDLGLRLSAANRRGLIEAGNCSLQFPYRPPPVHSTKEGNDVSRVSTFPAGVTFQPECFTVGVGATVLCRVRSAA